MSAVLITGCSGAGKSTIAAVLACRGLAVIDADDDPSLARFVDPAGAVVLEEPAAPDLAWLARHSWAWDPVRLDELIGAAAPATLYVCGGAANELELADRFTHIVLLEIDEPTMLARLDERRDYHDWGRIGDTREHLRRFLPGYQDRLRAFGVIRIDARQPLDHVVDAILSHTLATRPRARPASRAIPLGTRNPQAARAAPRHHIQALSSWFKVLLRGGGSIKQYSWPAPVPPGGRQGTIRLIRCARCKGPLYHTKTKGQPRQEDHEQGCEAFLRATQVMLYAEELKRSASKSPVAWGRTWRRRYLQANAKKLSAAACASDPVAAVSVLGDFYQAECQPHGKPVKLPEKTEMAETLMRACQQLALGQEPAPITFRPR